MKDIVFALGVFLCLSCASTHAQRVALIIGNLAYLFEHQIKNPVHNASF